MYTPSPRGLGGMLSPSMVEMGKTGFGATPPS